MRIFDKQTADTYMVGNIEVVRWEQYGLGDSLPFGGMWYTVPPGSISPPDCHPDIEISFVISGSAAVETTGPLVGAPRCVSKAAGSRSFRSRPPPQTGRCTWDTFPVPTWPQTLPPVPPKRAV